MKLTVLLLALGCTIAHTSAQNSEQTAIYQKDVEFLLEELPKEAGRFFELKRIDWLKVSEDFRRQAEAVRTDQDHLKLCSRLLARLRDGHAGIVQSKVSRPDASQGRTWSGPGVHLLVIGDGVYIRQISPVATRAGMKVGQRLEKIDGVIPLEWLKRKAETMSDLRGFSTEHQGLYAACHTGLADWSGTKITLTVAEANGASRDIELTRDGSSNFVPLGPIFPPPNLKRYDRNTAGRTERGFGYIHLRKIPGDLDKQLDTMLEEIGDVPGLILDVRANGGGGCDHNAVFGRFVPSEKSWRQYVSNGQRPFTGPMVVIVDAGVASAGETVSGMFKEDGRAYMIGDSATAGMSSSKKTLALPSGLFSAYYSVYSNKARFNEGRGIEGIGVPPHEVVPYDANDLLAGIDTQIRRAEELLGTGFPPDVVPYHLPQTR